MEFYLKYQQVILRTMGGILLVGGFVIHFWTMPQKGVSQNDRASANLARMEASVQGSSSQKKDKSTPDSSQFLKELKGQQKKQMEYLTILLMILGTASLGYSFFKKKEETSQT